MKFSNIIEPIASRKIGLRLGALGLAVILWVFIVSGETYNMSMSVPFEVRNLSEQKALSKEVPELAQVRFKGTGRELFKTILLKKFYPDFKLVLDLDRISDEYEFVLNDYYREYPQKIVIPNEFDITYIEVDSPREIKISIDNYAVKKVPINSKIVINAAPGYIVMGKVQSEPLEIEITGPEEIVQNITTINTVADTITNAKIDIMRNFDFELPNRQIQLSQPNLKITADIQALSESIISEIPIVVKNVPDGYRVFVSPHTVSLTIIGGVDRITSIKPNQIQLSIDFKRQWNSNKQFYEPQVNIPRGVIKWQDLSPPNVELIVSRDNN